MTLKTLISMLSLRNNDPIAVELYNNLMWDVLLATVYSWDVALCVQQHPNSYNQKVALPLARFDHTLSRRTGRLAIHVLTNTIHVQLTIVYSYNVAPLRILYSLQQFTVTMLHCLCQGLGLRRRQKHKQLTQLYQYRSC